MLLAADIGGSNTRFALSEYHSGQLQIVHQAHYKNSEYASFEELLHLFLQNTKTTIESACFALAGPLDHGKIHLTNLSWQIDPEKIQQSFPIKHLFLINDLKANAAGIDLLNETELTVLQKPTIPLKGNRALVSAGTGLGIAALYLDPPHYHPFATEGGHADFAPRNDKEIALLRYLSKSFGHVSIERVLSGPGLVNITRFLNDIHKRALPKQDSLLTAASISKCAFEKSDSICIEALEMFVQIYGAVCGNCALSYLSYGGLYLGGGIAPKIIEMLKSPLFLDAFLEKGRFKALLKNIPIFVIMNSQTALLGAGKLALQRLVK